MPDLRRTAITAARKMLRKAVPLLRLLPGTASSQEPPNLPSPRRILLLHPGHLGDMVISTSILDALEAAFPNAEIGFVAGSWAAHAVQGVRGIARVHIVDHWRLNRGLPSLIRRWMHYRETRAPALREIRAQHYDIAISLLDVDPDLLDIAWAARIPVRIGWTGSFFAPMATRTVPRSAHRLQHQAMRQAQSLSALNIKVPALAHLQSRVVDDSDESLREVCAALGVQSLEALRFRIIHMGAGAPMKQMSQSFWLRIARELAPHHTLLFTGRGREEQQAIAAVMQGLPNCFDACDKLSWKGFVTAIRAAEMLYGVDSMAGHVAAAVGTPIVSAYQGAGGVSRWRPLSDASIVFTNHLPCAPCLQPMGCAAMPCRQVSPADFLAVSPSDLLTAPAALQPAWEHAL